MKKFISILATAFFAIAASTQAQSSPTYTAQAGASLFTGTPATATFTSGATRLPNFSGSGVLTITGSGITGSPSGCTVALKYQGNNSPTVGTAVATISVTPSTGVQTFTVAPSVLMGDSYVATFACSTYPTAGTLSASFSPVSTTALDPCFTSAKSSVSVAITTATTTQLVALAAGKSVYVCGFTASFGATTTAQFEYGTGATCGTGTTVLTGTFTPGTGVVLSLATDGTEFSAPAGNALCAVSTGTGGIQGVLTYVQQ
jgi:hypothetical protein